LAIMACLGVAVDERRVGVSGVVEGSGTTKDQKRQVVRFAWDRRTGALEGMDAPRDTCHENGIEGRRRRRRRSPRALGPERR